MDAEAYLSHSAALVDEFLEGVLPRVDEPPKDLHAAMRHLIFPGGKRLRPALAFAACEATGAPARQALPLAGAVELIHTYSLIHDDLPCMDDDRERRGRPTVHVAFGEATAVLAGDALQAAAFGALATADLEPRLCRDAIRDLAEAAGAGQLVGGQFDDLHCDRASLDETAIESIHRRKSAALIGVAIVGGARLAGADPDRLQRLRRFGSLLGLGFQIADDLLDRHHDEVCSMVRVLGADAARSRAEECLDRALALIEDLGRPADALRELARFAVRRNR